MSFRPPFFISGATFESLSPFQLTILCGLVATCRSAALYAVGRAIRTIFPRSNYRLRRDGTLCHLLRQRTVFSSAPLKFMLKQSLIAGCLALTTRFYGLQLRGITPGGQLSAVHMNILSATFVTSVLFRHMSLPLVPVLDAAYARAAIAENWSAVMPCAIICMFTNFLVRILEEIYECAKGQSAYTTSQLIKRGAIALAGVVGTCGAVSAIDMASRKTRYSFAQYPLCLFGLATTVDSLTQIALGRLANELVPMALPAPPSEDPAFVEGVMQQRYEQASALFPGVTQVDDVAVMIGNMQVVLQSQRLNHRGRLYLFKLFEGLLGLHHGLTNNWHLGLRSESFQIVAEEFEFEDAGRGSRAVDGSKQCAICLEDYEENAELARLPCKHVYHRRCAREWLAHNEGCPSCRQDVREHEWYRDAASRRNAVSREEQARKAVEFFQREVNLAFGMRFSNSIERASWAAAVAHYCNHAPAYPARERMVDPSLLVSLPLDFDTFPMDLLDLFGLFAEYSLGIVDADD